VVRKNRQCDLWVSPITYAEVLEGAADAEATRELLGTFQCQAIGRQHAERSALRQSRFPEVAPNNAVAGS
jgi:hypothetical protein